MSLRPAISKLFKELRNYARLRTKICGSQPNAGRLTTFSDHVGGQRWCNHGWEVFHWVSLSGPAAIILGTFFMPSFADDGSNDTNFKSRTGSTYNSAFQKIEDGSVISNEHTSKWRIFTDNGRDYFLKGNIDQAEKFFQSALQEAREGFGDTDPHVASACNNLAELFRVKKDFDKAEPLYLEAIEILEKHFGAEDVRVGAALHNLGQFYLVQRKLEKARLCYERALKIKRRVLGAAHPEYADAIYHLGSVLYLQGEEKDSVDLIADSIRILEAGGQGESTVCIRRMQYLAQIYTKSNQFVEAEALLRKILHIVELSKLLKEKRAYVESSVVERHMYIANTYSVSSWSGHVLKGTGWKSLDTLMAAERLALVLEKASRLMEAEEILERCLDARRNLLPHEHIQNAANMLHIARVKMLISRQLIKTNGSQDMAALDRAKDLLLNSIRVAQQILVRSLEQKGKEKPSGIPRRNEKDVQSPILILLQSLNALGSLEVVMLELMDSGEHIPQAEAALSQCVSTFQEFGSESPQVKAEYLSCLKHLDYLISSGMASKVQNPKEIRGEILRVESELAKAEKTLS